MKRSGGSSGQNIIVALQGAIGDVILSTPLLEGLRLAFPTSKITYLVGSTAAPALENLELIDEILILPDGKKASRWNDLRLIATLLSRRFDLAICLSRMKKLAFALWISRTPARLCYTPLRFSWMFTHRVDGEDEVYSRVHRTCYFLAALAKLGMPQPPQICLHYVITPQERERAEHLLRNSGVDLERDVLVAIHPGTSRIQVEKRRWSSSNFAEVARHVLQQADHKVVLLGGPDEKELAEAFRGELSRGVIDFINKLSIRELAAILERCALLVHNDSMPLHLAVAVGTPVLAIFGYQNPSLWGPLGRLHRVVRRDIGCSPCLPEFACDRDYECIRRLEPSMVIEILDSMLERAKAHP